MNEKKCECYHGTCISSSLCPKRVHVPSDGHLVCSLSLDHCPLRRWPWSLWSLTIQTSPPFTTLLPPRILCCNCEIIKMFMWLSIMLNTNLDNLHRWVYTSLDNITIVQRLKWSICASVVSARRLLHPKDYERCQRVIEIICCCPSWIIRVPLENHLRNF